MEKIINILLENKLENLNGFKVLGELRIPKEILANAITHSIINRKKETSENEVETADNDALLKPKDYRNLLDFVDINEANVYFDGEEVCIRLDIEK